MNCYLEAMQLGAVDYLEEPLKLDEMLRAVKAHLDPSCFARPKVETEDRQRV